MSLLVSVASQAGTTPGIDTTGCQLLVVALRAGGAPATPLSDSKGNTWTALAISQDGFYGLETRFFYTFSASPTSERGSGHTFTTGYGSSGYPIVVLGFDNIAASPYDAACDTGAGTGGGNTHTSLSVGPVTPGQANTLILASCQIYGDGDTLSALTASGWTAGAALTDGPNVTLGVRYIEQGGAAAVTANWTWSTSGTKGIGAGRLAGFKLGTAPAGTASKHGRLLLGVG